MVSVKISQVYEVDWLIGLKFELVVYFPLNIVLEKKGLDYSSFNNAELKVMVCGYYSRGPWGTES